jgi:hypothetical protein
MDNRHGNAQGGSEIIYKYREILNDPDYLCLRRRLSPKLFLEIILTNVSSKKSPNLIWRE